MPLIYDKPTWNALQFNIRKARLIGGFSDDTIFDRFKSNHPLYSELSEQMSDDDIKQLLKSIGGRMINPNIPNVVDQIGTGKSLKTYSSIKDEIKEKRQADFDNAEEIQNKFDEAAKLKKWLLRPESQQNISREEWNMRQRDMAIDPSAKQTPFTDVPQTPQIPPDVVPPHLAPVPARLRAKYGVISTDSISDAFKKIYGPKNIPPKEKTKELPDYLKPPKPISKKQAQEREELQRRFRDYVLADLKRIGIKPEAASTLEYLYNSSKAGAAQFAGSMANIPRVILGQAGLDDSELYKKLSKTVAQTENNYNALKLHQRILKEGPIRMVLKPGTLKVMGTTKDWELENVKGIKGFLGTGVEGTVSNLVPMLVSVVGGSLAGGAVFGMRSFGGYAREAEKEGAHIEQQVAMGLAGILAEALPETVSMTYFLKTFGIKLNNPLVKAGVKSLGRRFGIFGLKALSTAGVEAVQEMVTEPLSAAAKKIIYNPNMKWYGKNGIIDPKNIFAAGYAGLATGTIFAALGMPFGAARTYLEHKIAKDGKLSFEDMTKVRVLLQKDIEPIKNALATNSVESVEKMLVEKGKIDPAIAKSLIDLATDKKTLWKRSDEELAPLVAQMKQVDASEQEKINKTEYIKSKFMSIRKPSEANDFAANELKKLGIPDKNIRDTVRSWADQKTELSESQKQIYKKKAYVDNLMQIPNRDFIDENDLGNTKNNPNRITAMIDVDHFKKFNDKYGHETGDDVLEKLGNILNKYKEKYPGLEVGRYGGEEILISFDNMSPKKAADIIDNIRKDFNNVKLENVKETLNFSSGLSQNVTEADAMLYAAKHAGRGNTKIKTKDVNIEMVKLIPTMDEIEKIERIINHSLEKYNRYVTNNERIAANDIAKEILNLDKDLSNSLKELKEKVKNVDKKLDFNEKSRIISNIEEIQNGISTRHKSLFTGISERTSGNVGQSTGRSGSRSAKDLGVRLLSEKGISETGTSSEDILSGRSILNEVQSLKNQGYSAGKVYATLFPKYKAVASNKKLRHIISDIFASKETLKSVSALQTKLKSLNDKISTLTKQLIDADETGNKYKTGLIQYQIKQLQKQHDLFAKQLAVVQKREFYTPKTKTVHLKSLNQDFKVYVPAGQTRRAGTYQGPRKTVYPVQTRNEINGLVKDIAASVNNPQKAIVKLKTLGTKIYQSGYTKVNDWMQQMKNLLGNLWQTFKSQMQWMYNKIRDESGHLGLKDNIPVKKKRRQYKSKNRIDIAYATEDVKAIRHDKNILVKENYPVEATKQLVLKYYDKSKYKSFLQGQDNVFLVMPSTKGSNKICQKFAEKLANDFGGEVIDYTEYVDVLHEKEAKHRNIIEKLEHPSEYKLTKDLSRYKGKNVIIVEDVVNTGESVDTLKAELTKQGLNDVGVISLGGTSKYIAYEKDVDKLINQIKRWIPDDYETVKKVITDFIAGRNRKFVYELTKKAGSKKNAEKIYELVRSRSKTVQTDGEGIRRIQQPSGTGGRTQLAEGTQSKTEPVGGRTDVKRSSSKSLVKPQKTTTIPDTGKGLDDPALDKIISEFDDADLKEFVKNGVAGIKETINIIRSIISPSTLTEASSMTAAIIRRASGKYKQWVNIATDSSAAKERFFDKFTKRQVIEYITAVETGDLNKLSPTLKRIAQEHRARLEDNYKMITDVKGFLNYIENYFPHIWKKSDSDDVKAKISQLKEMISKRPLEGQKSFLKKRVLDLFKMGIELGLEPVNWNPERMVLANEIQVRKYKMAHDIFDNIKDMGFLQFVRPGQKIPEGYVKINDSLFESYRMSDEGLIVNGSYLAPKTVGKILNNHLSPGLEKYALYRGFRYIANLQNMVQLGISAFHFTMTTLTTIANDMTLGLYGISQGQFLKGISLIGKSPLAPLENYFLGQRFMKSWEGKLVDKDGLMAKITQYYIDAGGSPKLDVYYTNNDYDAFIKAIKAYRPGKAVIKLIPALVEATSKPLMQKYVPYLKLAGFYKSMQIKLAANKDASSTEIWQMAVKSLDDMDYRFGQMIYDNRFWNKTIKQIGQLSMRSLGWNMGDVLMIRDAVDDVMSMRYRPGMKKITDRMLFLLVYPAVIATTGAIMTYLFTGKAPDELKDYFYPPTGEKDMDGSPVRLSIPGYHKDVFGTLEAMKQYGPVLGAAKVVSNKAHPFMSYFMKMIANEDYWGDKIFRDWKDKSPWYKNIANKMEDWVKFTTNDLTPFSVQSIMKLRKQQVPLPKQMLAFAGFVKAPRYIARSQVQRKIFELYNAHFPDKSRTPEEKEIAQFKSDIRRKIYLGTIKREEVLELWQKCYVPIIKNKIKFAKTNKQAKGIYNRYQTYFKKFLLRSKNTSDMNAFAGLSREEQINVLKNYATQTEKRKYVKLIK